MYKQSFRKDEVFFDKSRCPSCNEGFKYRADRPGCSRVMCHGPAHKGRAFLWCFHCKEQLLSLTIPCKNGCPLDASAATRRRLSGVDEEHPIDVGSDSD